MISEADDSVGLRGQELKGKGGGKNHVFSRVTLL